ncbi:MAG: DUF748 domain-containing protein [Bacteroidales bacterium]|nr:DUF748 domain-containing protein [Bacteroidales bacterium]
MKKFLIISASIVLFLLLIIEIVVPLIAKNYIVNHAKELIGRQVDVGSLGLNIFTGSIYIKDFTLYEADDTANFISFDLLDVNASIVGLLQGKIEIESLLLQQAQYNIIQDGTRFNFSDMIEFFAPDSTLQADTTASDWKIIINNIDISRNQLNYQDCSIGSEWHLHDLSLAIPSIDLSDPNADMGLFLNFVDGGSLVTNIKFNPTDSIYDLNINIDKFSLAPLLPYLKQAINIETIEGYLTTAVDIRGSMQHVLNFDVMGTLAIDSLKILAPDSANILSFDSLYNEIKTFNLSERNIAFGRVYTAGLSSKFEIFSDTENTITRLLSPVVRFDSLRNDTTQLAHDTSADTASAMPRISIDDFVIVNSSAQFVDHTLPQPFEYNITDIEVTAPKFVMQSNDNDVHMTATLQNTGHFDLRWRGGISDIANQDVSFALNNVELKSFSPYTLYMFASPITDGRLTVRSQNLIKKRKLDGVNHIGIVNPKIGDKEKSIKPQMRAPLKLALYILTDKDNSISIDMPVKGDIDSPDFSYGKVLLNTFTNLLVKVAASPFSVFKSDASETEYIDVEPYDTRFTDEQLATITSIADVLSKKPDIRLSFVQEIDKERAIASYCTAQLKKNFYLAQNNMDSTQTNDIIVRERALKIADSNKELIAFADNAIQQVGITIDKDATLEQKATTLYASNAKQRIAKDAETRAAALRNFLSQQCAIGNPAVSTEYISIKKGLPTRFHAKFEMK